MEGLTNLYSSITTRFSFLENKTVQKQLLMFPGAGCEYWKKSGGCTMCGFHNATQKFSFGILYPPLVFKAMFRLAEDATADELAVFNGGSFWNSREIPESFSDYLFTRLGRLSRLKRVMIENRPEYVTEAKICSAKRKLGDKRLTLAMGFESQDDFIRNSIIRKGVSKRLFEEKVRLIAKSGATSLAYVFLKPVGLSERKALKEAFDTIRYLLDIGVNEVELSCAFVQENTPMFAAFKGGEFKPPKLWSVLAIIEEAQKNGWPLRVGGFTDEPPPVAIPANCPSCSPVIYEAIERYRIHGKLGAIPDCKCKSEYPVI